MSSLSILHRVSIPAPQTHVVEVETTLTASGGALPAEIVLFMPVWSPGSYLVREYSRHVEALSAELPARAGTDPANWPAPSNKTKAIATLSTAA